jgi:hypothetical protein
MKRSSLVALALLLALTLFASAQEPSGKRDAQSSFEPRSGPGAGQKLLERMAGDWDVAKTFYPRNGEPVRSNGTCKQTMIQGGRFLKSEFTFGEGDNESTGLGIVGFETGSGKFTSVWVDSRRTQMSMRQSSEPFDGKQIVMYSRNFGDNPNGPYRSRTVSHLEDDDRKLVHRQYARDREGKERLMMELVLTRKASGGNSSGR